MEENFSGIIYKTPLHGEVYSQGAKVMEINRSSQDCSDWEITRVEKVGYKYLQNADNQVKNLRKKKLPKINTTCKLCKGKLRLDEHIEPVPHITYFCTKCKKWYYTPRPQTNLEYFRQFCGPRELSKC